MATETVSVMSVSPVSHGETVTYHFPYLVAVILSDSNLAIIPSGSLVAGELPDG